MRDEDDNRRHAIVEAERKLLVAEDQLSTAAAMGTTHEYELAGQEWQAAQHEVHRLASHPK